MLRSTCWAIGVLTATTGLVAEERAAKPDGREIFERTWTANDVRSHGGDGLGPVFNAASCVACHDQGGAGGGGAFDKNVRMLTLSLPAVPRPETMKDADLGKVADHVFNSVVREPLKRAAIRQKAAERFHPDFVDVDTVVLHAQGVDEEAHRQWHDRAAIHRQQLDIQGVDFTGFRPSFEQTMILSDSNLSGLHSGFVVNGVNPNSFPVLAEAMTKINQLKTQGNGGVTAVIGFEEGSILRTSQRNTTALWGAGLIDRIPNEAIEAIAKRQAEAGGRISGRPHRMADGSLGRFGWKGQKASLYDFTIAACANELGLEVPGAHQATVAYAPDHEPKGFDLNEAEVDALVDYLAKLPAPAQKSSDVAKAFETGREVFASIGCASCHVEQVGEVVGLYSDLLLHDMGADLGAVGSYGVPSTPEPDPRDVPVAGADGEAKPVGPTSREWRTAPLWGVASSAPYLHDGRAKTIEQAIAFHGGEAAESRLRYLLLDEKQRTALSTFLDGLVAPEVATRD